MNSNLNFVINTENDNEIVKESILTYLNKIIHLLHKYCDDNVTHDNNIKDIIPYFDIINSLCIGLEAVLFNHLCVYQDKNICKKNLNSLEIFGLDDLSNWKLIENYINFAKLQDNFFAKCRDEMFDFLIKLDDIRMLENFNNKNIPLDNLLSKHTLSKIWVRYCINNFDHLKRFMEFSFDKWNSDYMNNIYHNDAFILDNIRMRYLIKLLDFSYEPHMPKIPLLNVNIYYSSYNSTNYKPNLKFSSASLIVAGFKSHFIKNNAIVEEVPEGEEVTEESLHNNSSGQSNYKDNEPLLANIQDPYVSINPAINEDKLQYYTEWFKNYSNKKETTVKTENDIVEEMLFDPEEILTCQVDLDCSTIALQNSSSVMIETNDTRNQSFKKELFGNDAGAMIASCDITEGNLNLDAKASSSESSKIHTSSIIDSDSSISNGGNTQNQAIESRDGTIVNNLHSIFTEENLIDTAAISFLGGLASSSSGLIVASHNNTTSCHYSEENLSIDPSEDMERIFTVYSFDKKKNDVIKMRHKIAYHLIKSKMKKDQQQQLSSNQKTIIPSFSGEIFKDEDLKFYIARFDMMQTERGLDLLNNKCANHFCHKSIGFDKEYRICHFDGYYYCLQCHNGETASIPSRITHNWDFKLYKVCKLHKQLLEYSKEDPLVYLSPDLSKKLDTLLPGFRFIRKARLSLRSYYAKYLSNCSYNAARKFAHNLDVLRNVTRNYMALALPFAVDHEFDQHPTVKMTSTKLLPHEEAKTFTTNFSSSPPSTSSDNNMASESSSQLPSTFTTITKKTMVVNRSFLEPTDLYSVQELDRHIRFDRDRDKYCTLLEKLIKNGRDHILKHCPNCHTVYISCTNPNCLDNSFVTFKNYVSFNREYYSMKSQFFQVDDAANCSIYDTEYQTHQNIPQNTKASFATLLPPHPPPHNLFDSTEFINFMLKPLCRKCYFNEKKKQQN